MHNNYLSFPILFNPIITPAPPLSVETIRNLSQQCAELKHSAPKVLVVKYVLSSGQGIDRGVKPDSVSFHIRVFWISSKRGVFF